MDYQALDVLQPAVPLLLRVARARRPLAHAARTLAQDRRRDRTLSPAARSAIGRGGPHARHLARRGAARAPGRLIRLDPRGTGGGGGPVGAAGGTGGGLRPEPPLRSASTDSRTPR